MSRVSILVPAFNAAPWIGETLDSALGQSHRDREIIVVDDGSRDDTLERARAFARRHPDEIRVTTQTNAGASAARNHALRLARGEFIQFLDADDLLSPRKVEAQLALLAPRPRATLAPCRWGRFCDDPAAIRFADDDLAREFTPAEWLKLNLGAHRMMHPAAWLVPRSLADAAGPWDESLSLNDDGEYFARVVARSVGIACSAEVHTGYRTGSTSSLSRTRTLRGWRSLRRSLELTADALLRIENSPSARSAAADALQRFVYEVWPAAPEERQAAARRIRTLGGSKLRPELPPSAARLARLIGWRGSRLLQLIYQSLTSVSAVSKKPTP